MGSSLNPAPFWDPFYKGAVLYRAPNLESYPSSYDAVEKVNWARVTQAPGVGLSRRSRVSGLMGLGFGAAFCIPPIFQVPNNHILS